MKIKLGKKEVYDILTFSRKSNILILKCLEIINNFTKYSNTHNLIPNRVYIVRCMKGG